MAVEVVAVVVAVAANWFIPQTQTRNHARVDGASQIVHVPARPAPPIRRRGMSGRR